MSVRDELEEINGRFCAALGAHDLGALMPYYADDVSLLIPGAPPIGGAPAVAEYYKGVFAAGVESATMRIDRVEELEDGVLEHGTYEMALDPPDGARFSDHGKYMVFHVRSGSSLQCRFDMFHSDAGSDPESGGA